MNLDGLRVNHGGWSRRGHSTEAVKDIDDRIKARLEG